MSSAAASMTLSPKVASRPSLRFGLKAGAMPVRPNVVSRPSVRISSATVRSMSVATMHEQGGCHAFTYDYRGGDPLTQPAGHLDRAITIAELLLKLGIPSSSFDFLRRYNGQHEQGGCQAFTYDYPGGDFTLKRPLTQPAGHLDRAITIAELLLELGIPPSSFVFHVQDGFTPRISRPLSPQVTPLLEWGSSAHQCRLRTFLSGRSFIVRAASRDSAPTPPSNPPDGARSLPPTVVKWNFWTVLEWILRICGAVVHSKPKTGSGPVEIGISFGVFIMFNGRTDLLIGIFWVAYFVRAITVGMDDVTHAGVNLNVDNVKTEIQGLKAEIEGLKTEIQGLKAENEGLKTEVKVLTAKVDSLQGMTAKVDSLLGMLIKKFDGIAKSLHNMENGGITASNSTSLNNNQNGGITGLSPQA